MTETITRWLENILAWAAIIPQEGWAIIIGVILGSAATQWLKRTFPASMLFPTMSKQFHVMWIRVSALFFASVPTYIIWPDNLYEFWAAAVVGFVTPAIYRLCTFMVYKRWPELEDRWSGTE